jgi:hypothetical protein
MLNKTFYILFFLTIITNSFSATKNYTVGSGSEFLFTSAKNEKINLSIYISESSFTQLGVEYFFSTNGSLFNTSVWQQYKLGIKDSGLSLDEGYIQSSNMTKPEIMSADFLKNNPDGVEISDFFFSKESDIEKYKIGLEKIEVPAGSVVTTHYKKSRNGQNIDFWISDSAGAIGLVKLVSTGAKNKDQDYKIELQSLLKNVKAKINPKDAVPLTDKGRLFLGKVK